MVSVVLTAAPQLSPHSEEQDVFLTVSAACSRACQKFRVIFEMDQDIASMRHFSIITHHNKVAYEKSLC